MNQRKLYLLITIFAGVLAAGFFINTKLSNVPIKNVPSLSPSPIPSPFLSPTIVVTPEAETESTEIADHYLI